MRLEYLEEGSGPLLVMVHGFPDTAHGWDEIRPVVARAGYRVVCPFLRGYWPSAVPEDRKYDSDTLGHDLLELIDTLGAKQAILVGHDWGASAAYSATALGPERVSFLVAVGVPHPASIRPLPRIAWAARHFVTLKWKSAEARMRANDFAHVDELVRRWSPAWSPPPEETKAVKEAFQKPGCLEAALGYYRAVHLKPPRSLTRPVTVPCAVFCGRTDPSLLRADYEHARSWYRGSYELIELPGGHFLHREHPAQFCEELLRVLPRA